MKTLKFQIKIRFLSLVLSEIFIQLLNLELYELDLFVNFVESLSAVGVWNRDFNHSVKYQIEKVALRTNLKNYFFFLALQEFHTGEYVKKDAIFDAPLFEKGVDVQNRHQVVEVGNISFVLRHA